MPYNDPLFPIVNPSPSVDDCLKSMRFRDYMVFASATATSWGYGYICGKPVRGPTAATAATIGFTFAGMVVLQDTRCRLMGYKENAKEISKYGMWHEQTIKSEQVDPRFPIAINQVSPVMKPPLNWRNYD